MNTRLARPLSILALVLFGCTLGLATAEAGLRMVGWRTPGYYVNGRGPLALRAAGEKGGVYPPGTDGRLKHYDYDVAWYVNDDGFRDRAVTPKAAGVWRIGFLGDSFTAGTGVELNERFSNRWFDRAPHAHQSEQWNLASPVCGTACEAAIASGVARKYQLDEIILGFYAGNDFDDNVLWFDNPAALVATQKQGMRDWLREHSRTATFLWVTAFRGAARFTPPGVYSDSTMARVWHFTERGLNDLLAAAHGRPLTILYIPALPEWSEEAWQTAKERWNLADGGRHLARSRVSDWAARHNVRFIDTSAWLQQCKPAADCVFPVDGHWNAKGHRLVAEGLLKELTASN